jgi:bifunctional UDP-N-acetylglucosamine pyrophosphorylase/glucosamine-1-phosphate N-acetyltransferase
MPEVAEAAAPWPCALQREQLGTADAVKAAAPALEAEIAAGGELLILYGDGPLITSETLEAMRAARLGEGAPDFVWLGFRPTDPFGYGRLIEEGGRLARIVEEKDAGEDERAVGLCWAGLLLGRIEALFPLLEKIDNDNAKGEYYLTDLVALAEAEGLTSGVVETAEAEEVLGVNTKIELAEAEAVMQRRLRRRAMEAGATLEHPETVILQHDTLLEPDCRVEANVVFGKGVTVRSGATIRAFSHLEEAEVGAGTSVGPFARLRGGVVLGEEVRVGNFVEVKNATFGKGAKASHLTYVGDASVGAAANLGAGTITCNYDGFLKSRTEIGAGAFIGSNSALVAPVTIGEGAIVGAGSTVTRDVDKDDMVVVRGKEVEVPGGAKRFRERRARQMNKKD